MITKTKFEVYEDIRESGITNMFDITGVVASSGGELNKEDCLDIMGNYSKYKFKYKEELDSKCYCQDAGLSAPHLASDH